MDNAKQKIVEQFISGCEELGLSPEECVDLAARNLIGATIASGNSHVRVEVDNMGIVEVEC